MLSNTVIKVTFGDLRAQQISAIIFQCGVLYHTEFAFLWLFIHLRPRKNGFKYLALLINIFILKGNIIWTCSVGPVTSLSVAFISFAKNLPIFFLSYWGHCSHWIYKIKSGGHRARLRENEHLSCYRALFEGNLLRFVRARAHLRALMTQKSCAVGMRNAKLGNHLKFTP